MGPFKSRGYTKELECSNKGGANRQSEMGWGGEMRFAHEIIGMASGGGEDLNVKSPCEKRGGVSRDFVQGERRGLSFSYLI